MATFLPSTNPASFRPCRNALTRYAKPAAGVVLRNPITGIAGCCARTASGHAAAPPRTVTNSRRLRSSIQVAPQAPPRENCASLRRNSNGFDHACPSFDLALDEFLEILGGPAVGGDKRIA